MSDRDVTSALMRQLEQHYLKPSDRLPAGVLLPEVGWNGSDQSCRCDALFVGFTSASSRLLVGHEVKASRSDWLRELAKTGKADGWADQCHQWWIVTIPGVIADGELPQGWGLMVPGGRTKMKIVTPAVTRANLTPSWDASRSIIARLNTLHRTATNEVINVRRAEMDAQYQERVDRAVEYRLRTVHGTAELQALLDRYEKALGGRLVDDTRGWGNDYTDADLAAAAEWLNARHQVQRAGTQLNRSPQVLQGIRRNLEQARDALAKLDILEQAAGDIGRDLGMTA